MGDVLLGEIQSSVDDPRTSSVKYLGEIPVAAPDVQDTGDSGWDLG